MKINKYPDGGSFISNINIKPLTFKINTYEDLWHLNQFVDAFNSKFSIKPNITIPNLIDAQQDVRFNQDESSGLKLICKFLNSMDVNKFYIFHPHNPEVVEALMGNVEIIDNSEFIKQVLGNHITGTTIGHFGEPNQYFGGDNLILMSSDAGGFKPLMKLCDKINWQGETYSASKARTKDGMKQFIDRQDFEGKDILIIDDISVYGGTFKGLSKLLRERNCGKLYLAVSHITVQNLGNNPVTNYFDKVFTTNSKFDEYYTYFDNLNTNRCKTPTNLEIIKLFKKI
jgi:ribose-phosphate pyrophosphokinase